MDVIGLNMFIGLDLISITTDLGLLLLFRCSFRHEWVLALIVFL